LDTIVVPLPLVLAALRAFFRALALLYVLPWADHGAVPHQVRVLLAVLLGPVLWLPSSATAPALPDAPEDLVLLLAGDLLLAAGVGMTVRLVLAGAAAAAAIVGLQVGLTMSAVLDPLSGSRRDPVGRIYEWLTLVLLLSTGLHRHVLVAFSELWSMDARPSLSGLAHLAATADVVFTLGLRLAAPLLAALLMADLVIGLSGRLLPQVQVLAITYPLKLLVGLGVTALALPLTLRLIATQLLRVPASWPAIVAAP
jgi:flagellar biosynthetic protein FliR